MKNKELYIPIIISAIITAVAAAVCFSFSIYAALICAAVGIAIIAVFAFFTIKRYRAIANLNDYLSLVCSGNYRGAFVHSLLFRRRLKFTAIW